MNSIKYKIEVNRIQNKQEDQGSQLRQNELRYLSHQLRGLFSLWRQCLKRMLIIGQYTGIFRVPKWIKKKKSRLDFLLGEKKSLFFRSSTFSDKKKNKGMFCLAEFPSTGSTAKHLVQIPVISRPISWSWILSSFSISCNSFCCCSSSCLRQYSHLAD